MVTVGQILTYLDEKAPCRYKLDFDNVGLLVGHADHAVERVLLALDITQDVIAQAVQLGAQLIVSHHPLFFSLKAVSDVSLTGRRALALAEQGIAAICMHTNLDAAHDGVNDALAAALELQDVEVLEPAGEDAGGVYGIGRIGELEPAQPLTEWLPKVRESLAANGLRYYDAGTAVHRVAVGGGACGSYLELAARKGCDTFVTADVKYDAFLDAKALGINLVDADHFCTENVVIPVLHRWLCTQFPTLTCQIAQHVQTAQFFI